MVYEDKTFLEILRTLSPLYYSTGLFETISMLDDFAYRLTLFMILESKGNQFEIVSIKEFI